MMFTGGSVNRQRKSGGDRRNTHDRKRHTNKSPRYPEVAGYNEMVVTKVIFHIVASSISF